MLRGEDSTGIAVVPDKLTTPLIIKRAVIPTELFSLPACKALLKVAEEGGKALIGHNRAATKGCITDSSAHPFQIDNITLVHNGTLWQHYNLPQGHQFEVDSEAITHSIADIGIEETVKRLDGAFALVLFDSNTQKLHMLRNTKRPLWLAFIEKENTVLWASEKPMLELITSRNHMKVAKYMELKDHVLYTFDLEGELSSYTEVVVEGKKQWGDSYYAGYSRGYGNSSNIIPYRKKTPADLGYTVKDTKFIVDKLIPYPNSLQGRLIGYTCDSEAYLINVYGIRIADYEVGAEYMGEVCHVVEKPSYPTIELTVLAKSVKFSKSVEDYNKWLLGDLEEPATEKTWVELDNAMMTEEDATRKLSKGCCVCGSPIPLDDSEEVIEYRDDEYLCKECTITYLVDTEAFNRRLH